MVSRMQLQQMRQDRDEPVRAFSARLRGQAGVCSFKIECTCKTQVDYSNIMIRDSLIRGLEDEEIRLDKRGGDCEPYLLLQDPQPRSVVTVANQATDVADRTV